VGSCGQNDLVDALEFLSSLALLSGMDVEDKIKCTSPQRST
jgi:hypothetical protein